MAKIIVHDTKRGVVEREETDAEREARETAALVEEQAETVAREVLREENKNQRMQRAMARVLLGYKKNGDAGNYNKFLTDVFAKFDELGGGE